MCWHNHKATDYKSRLRHFQLNPPLPAANLDTNESWDEEPSDDQPGPPNYIKDITSLLSSALNLIDDNPELQEKIKMALSTANLVWVLRHGSTKIAPIISVYLIFMFP